MSITPAKKPDKLITRELTLTRVSICGLQNFDIDTMCGHQKNNQQDPAPPVINKIKMNQPALVVHMVFQPIATLKLQTPHREPILWKTSHLLSVL